MTERDAVEMLRERRALQQTAVAIRRQAARAPAWAYVLTAIDDRLKWSTYALSVTDPELMARAAAVLSAEAAPVFTSQDWAAAWAVTPGRIH
jgi:hypothetical protein